MLDIVYCMNMFRLYHWYHLRHQNCSWSASLPPIDISVSVLLMMTSADDSVMSPWTTVIVEFPTWMHTPLFWSIRESTSNNLLGTQVFSRRPLVKCSSGQLPMICQNSLTRNTQCTMDMTTCSYQKPQVSYPYSISFNCTINIYFHIAAQELSQIFATTLIKIYQILGGFIFSSARLKLIS